MPAGAARRPSAQVRGAPPAAPDRARPAASPRGRPPTGPRPPRPGDGAAPPAPRPAGDKARARAAPGEWRGCRGRSPRSAASGGRSEGGVGGASRSGGRSGRAEPRPAQVGSRCAGLGPGASAERRCGPTPGRSGGPGEPAAGGRGAPGDPRPYVGHGAAAPRGDVRGTGRSWRAAGQLLVSRGDGSGRRLSAADSSARDTCLRRRRGGEATLGPARWRPSVPEAGAEMRSAPGAPGGARLVS